MSHDFRFALRQLFLHEIFNVSNRSKLAVTVLRVSTGIMFLIAAWPKVSALDEWPERMVRFFGFFKETPPWYRAFLDAVVVPNADLFGMLVAFGELAVGLALVFGLLTRSALVAGLFMVVNYLLAKGTGFWVPSSNDSYLILILLALLFLRPGHFLGVDGWLVNWRRKKAVH